LNDVSSSRRPFFHYTVYFFQSRRDLNTISAVWWFSRFDNPGILFKLIFDVNWRVRTVAILEQLWFIDQWFSLLSYSLFNLMESPFKVSHCRVSKPIFNMICLRDHIPKILLSMLVINSKIVEHTFFVWQMVVELHFAVYFTWDCVLGQFRQLFNQFILFPLGPNKSVFFKVFILCLDPERSILHYSSN